MAVPTVPAYAGDDQRGSSASTSSCMQPAVSAASRSRRRAASGGDVASGAPALRPDDGHRRGLRGAIGHPGTQREREQGRRSLWCRRMRERGRQRSGISMLITILHVLDLFRSARSLSSAIISNIRVPLFADRGRAGVREASEVGRQQVAAIVATCGMRQEIMRRLHRMFRRGRMRSR